MVSMGTVWDRTTEFLSDNLGTVLPVALGAILVPSAISSSLSGVQQGATPGLGMGLGLASLVLGIVSFWGQLAITALALDPAAARGGAGIATRRLPAALLVTVALFLAMFVLIVPLAVILAAGGADIGAAMATGTVPEIPPPAARWLLIYILVLCPLALWLGARLLLMIPAIVGENALFGAIGRSWRLTRGSALKIVGVLILYGIVAWVAYLAATATFGAVITLIAGRGEDGLSLATVLTVIVGGAVSTAFTVLGTVFIAKLFLALRAANEAAPS